METLLQQYTAEHRFLLEMVRAHAGLANPVAIRLDQYEHELLLKARKGKLLPVDGVLVRDWDRIDRRTDSGIRLGMRLYHIDGIHFVRVEFTHHNQHDSAGLCFFAVDAPDYRALYRVALACFRESDKPPSLRPIMTAEQRTVLWQNTIGFLDSANLRRYQAYGIRAKRGVL